MAKRKSEQDVGAKQDAPPFDYSEAEWSEIEAAARAVLPDDKPLPNEVRESLVDRARHYQNGMSFIKNNQDWQQIARLSERLYQTIKCVWVLEGPTRDTEHILRGLEAFLEELLGIIDLAEDMIVPPDEEDRRPARVIYQSEVLGTWVYLGGKLRFSRSKRGPQGPLIRFFQAVTTPVMGASAPSVESIPDIIRRQKRLRDPAEVTAEETALQKANGDSQ
jgi:hypothetical protein